MADYDAFHLRLISKLINYEIPSVKFHEHLGKIYFEKDEINDEEYKLSKKLSFKLLYGSDIEGAREIEFFDKTYEFKDNLWQAFKNHEYIKTPKFKRIIPLSAINSANPGKIFSYLLQSYETEFNTEVINDLFGLIKKRKSKLVLYTYDSFLFDVHVEDKKILKKIKKIMEGEKMKVEISYGNRLSSLKKL